VFGRVARLVLVVPLVAGGVTALFVHASSARLTAPTDTREIYLADCATCHAADGSGSDRGPPILGSGRAGVDFYLSTGRMPLTNPTQAVERRTPRYDPQTIRELIGYISRLPGFHGPDIPSVDQLGADVARGGELFRLNCAACHSWSGGGGALLHREAPALDRATFTQMIQAMEVGPGNMPSFGAPALDAAAQRDVAAYAEEVSRRPDDRGGLPLWHLGPLPEGGVALFAGLLLLLVLARAIGTRE
jgi:ubiquinol-cytochrome c reductase cytochrome c subunit